MTTDSIISTTLSVRNAKLTFMLCGYHNTDCVTCPLLDKQNIPLTYALLCDSVPHIIRLFSYSLIVQSAVTATLSLGYAASLRPSEYLHIVNRHVLIIKQLISCNSFFWFDDIPFGVCDPHAYPHSRPDMFSSLLTHRKNDKLGKGSPIAIARPTKPVVFNCLQNLFDHLVLCPPLPNTPLLSGCNILITPADHIQPVLDALTNQHNLPPNKLLPHSSIRSAVLSQINDQSDEVKQRQGGWKSKSGMMIYTRPSFQHANLIANDIHDITKYPTTHLKHIFGSPR